MIHWEFVANRRVIDAELYSQQLELVHEIFRRRYTVLVDRNRVLLQQDNARPQSARTSMTKIQELGGIELLPHPVYSPDLAPSDYHLFRSMAQFLRGRNFENFEAVEVGLTEFFASKIIDWHRRGITNLAERWLKTIESEGLSTLKSSLISCQKTSQIKFCLKNDIICERVSVRVQEFVLKSLT